MTNFIISQILGFIALVLVCLSYSFNNKKSFLAYQIIANSFYAASFLVLGVLVGGMNTIISIIRVSVLYILEKHDQKPPTWLFVLFSLLYLLTGNLCFQSIYDLLAIIAYEIFNMAMFIRDITFTRLMMVFPNVMIVVYNILSQTYTNAALDMCEIIVLITMIIRFSWARQNKKFKFLM